MQFAEKSNVDVKKSWSDGGFQSKVGNLECQTLELLPLVDELLINRLQSSIERADGDSWFALLPIAGVDSTFRSGRSV